MPHICLRRFVPLTLAILSVLLPMTAEAQLSRVGATRAVIPGVPVVRGTSTAYDPVNKVFLVVHAWGGAVKGAFLDPSGKLLGQPFTLSQTAGFTHFPRVAYGAGKFIIVWHQDVGNSTIVHARPIVFGAPTAGSAVALGPSGWGEAGPGIAYSPTTQTYLVAWQTGGFQVHAVRLDSNGRKLGSVFRVDAAGASSRDPSVTWNPTTKEFGVSYSGWDSSSATVYFARVRPSDGAVLSRALINRAAGSFITDITFSDTTGNYVMAYSVGPTKVAEITPAGKLLAHRVSASSVGSKDGLSLAYNPTSDTILMAGHFSTLEVGGLELNNCGTALGSPRELTASGTQAGSFYPDVASASDLRLWSVAFALSYTSAAQQLVGSGSSTKAANCPPPNTGGGTGGVTNPPPSSGTCNAPAGLVCTAAGGWVPPTHPLAVTGGGSTPTTPNPTTPTQPKPSEGSCNAPAGLVCTAAGGWVPPNHPLAVTSGSGGSTGGGGSTSTPTCGGTPKPSGEWACVGNGWVPTSHPDAPAVPACTGSQLSGRPVAGWYRLPAGGWVPPSSPYVENAICRG